MVFHGNEFTLFTHEKKIENFNIFIYLIIDECLFTYIECD